MQQTPLVWSLFQLCDKNPAQSEMNYNQIWLVAGAEFISCLTMLLLCFIETSKY